MTNASAIVSKVNGSSAYMGVNNIYYSKFYLLSVDVVNRYIVLTLLYILSRFSQHGTCFNSNYVELSKLNGIHKML